MASIETKVNWLNFVRSPDTYPESKKTLDTIHIADSDGIEIIKFYEDSKTNKLKIDNKKRHEQCYTLSDEEADKILKKTDRKPNLAEVSSILNFVNYGQFSYMVSKEVPSGIRRFDREKHVMDSTFFMLNTKKQNYIRILTAGDKIAYITPLKIYVCETSEKYISSFSTGKNDAGLGQFFMLPGEPDAYYLLYINKDVPGQLSLTRIKIDSTKAVLIRTINFEVFSPLEIVGDETFSAFSLHLKTFSLVATLESGRIIKLLSLAKVKTLLYENETDVPEEKKDLQPHESIISNVTISSDVHTIEKKHSTVNSVFVKRPVDNSSGKYTIKSTDLRRGKSDAKIYSLEFDQPCKNILCASDHGTVHIFSTQLENNKSSYVSLLGGGYFGSKWSYTNFKVDSSNKFIATFGDTLGTILVLTYNKVLKCLRFTPDGKFEQVDEVSLQ